MTMVDDYFVEWLEILMLQCVGVRCMKKMCVMESDAKYFETYAEYFDGDW